VERHAVVVDLGGGTLDVSFVRAKATETGAEYGNVLDVELQVLASTGEAQLGGIDYNGLLLRYTLERIERDYYIPRSSFNDEEMRAIERQIENAKLMLSERKEAVVELSDHYDINGRNFPIRMDITERLMRETCSKLDIAVMKCVEACVDHGLTWYDAADVVSGNTAMRQRLEAVVDTVIIIAGQAGKAKYVVQYLKSRTKPDIQLQAPP
jgi:molecular chaperone DnaK (HSP70)